MNTENQKFSSEKPSSQGGVVKSWRDSDFECPECGGEAKVLTNAVAPYYWDGDELECAECGLKGGVQCDEDGATETWDW
jgi:predicted RNA-binding Zn-ribbon protein involved in translation (DUF1610 family)